MKKITTVFMLLFATACFAQFPYKKLELIKGHKIKMHTKSEDSSFWNFFTDPDCRKLYKKDPGIYDLIPSKELNGREFTVEDAVIVNGIVGPYYKITITDGTETLYHTFKDEDGLVFDVLDLKLAPEYYDSYIRVDETYGGDYHVHADWPQVFTVTKFVPIGYATTYNISLRVYGNLKEGEDVSFTLEDGKIIKFKYGGVTKFRGNFYIVSIMSVPLADITALSKSKIKEVNYNSAILPYKHANELQNSVARLLLKKVK